MRKKRMAMTKRNNAKEFGFLLGTIEEYVPYNHLVRKLEDAIDWNFIYGKVKSLYSEFGRPSIDPVILFKMIFINYSFGINSMRKTCEEIKVNLAYRWFLGISLDEAVPNYSTWSQNYIRRYGDSEVFNEIFDHILEQAIRKGYVDVSAVFGDSTHQKASANKRKANDKEVEITRKVYEEELLNEINEDRAKHNKKELKEVGKTELDFDAEGQEIEVKGETKHIKESTTDPESGLYHKGEHEKCFAYSHQTFCDKNNFVLASVTVPGNVHDSVSFYEAYNVLEEKFKDRIKNVCLDAGYNVGHICRAIYKNGEQPVLPYHRPMGEKKAIRKADFQYDEESDSYICPQGCILEYVTTNRDGYRQYRCKSCEGCPLKDACTKKATKTIFVHIWEHYRKEADEYRHTKEWKEIYPLRKETIERVFGDAKENHGLRYTRVRGLKKNQHQALIIFACHNLKKLGIWKWRDERKISFSFVKFCHISRLDSEVRKKPPFLKLRFQKCGFCQQSETGWRDPSGFVLYIMIICCLPDTA